MFNKVLIANRGEIARRIAYSAKKLGIKTVTFNGKENPPDYLVGLIDEFIQISIDAPSTYLDQEFVIKKAAEYGCDALHPGFGFLSENAEFAKKVTDAGIKFIGPDYSSIENMASKASARSLAIDSNVPVIEGLQGFKVENNDDISTVKSFAEKVGFPILIKAALGGGGKGMRVVREMNELSDAAARAYSEAINSFGDGNLIVEKYLENPRHVEVQVLGDEHGNVAIFGDRDCSIQRRHQKIIEEAPAPNLSEKIREAMHEASRRLAEKVNYKSAGTVEFLVDGNKENQTFYFLEMNTRLQVEHPVTEQVYGVDLVKWQFLVASGEKIPSPLLSPAPRGHSIESRIYAEDSFKDFFPTPCVVQGFLPFQGPGIRWELGLDTYDQITGAFDPMIAKLVTFAESRNEAIDLQVSTIERSHFGTEADNTSFLREIYSDKAFRSANDLSTSYIGKFTEGHLRAISAKREQIQSVADSILNRLESGEISSSTLVSSNPCHKEIIESSFLKKTKIRKSTSQNIYFTEYSQVTNQNLSNYKLLLGRGYLSHSDTNPLPFCYAIASNSKEKTYRVRLDGEDFSIIKKSELSIASGESSNSDPNKVCAPVPGKVISVEVKSGEKVEKGQKLFVLESMKMEFEVFSERDGEIAEVYCSESDQVEAGEQLSIFKED